MQIQLEIKKSKKSKGKKAEPTKEQRALAYFDSVANSETSAIENPTIDPDGGTARVNLRMTAVVQSLGHNENGQVLSLMPLSDAKLIAGDILYSVTEDELGDAVAIDALHPFRSHLEHVASHLCAMADSARLMKFDERAYSAYTSSMLDGVRNLRSLGEALGVDLSEPLGDLEDMLTLTSDESDSLWESAEPLGEVVSIPTPGSESTKFYDAQVIHRTVDSMIGELAVNPNRYSSTADALEEVRTRILSFGTHGEGHSLELFTDEKLENLVTGEFHPETVEFETLGIARPDFLTTPGRTVLHDATLVLVEKMDDTVIDSNFRQQLKGETAIIVSTSFSEAALDILSSDEIRGHGLVCPVLVKADVYESLSADLMFDNAIAIGPVSYYSSIYSGDIREGSGTVRIA